MAYTHKVIRNCIFVGLCFFQSFTAKGMMPTIAPAGIINRLVTSLGFKSGFFGDFIVGTGIGVVIVAIFVLIRSLYKKIISSSGVPPGPPQCNAQNGSSQSNQDDLQKQLTTQERKIAVLVGALQTLSQQESSGVGQADESDREKEIRKLKNDIEEGKTDYGIIQEQLTALLKKEESAKRGTILADIKATQSANINVKNSTLSGNQEMKILSGISGKTVNIDIKDSNFG